MKEGTSVPSGEASACKKKSRKSTALRVGGNLVGAGGGAVSLATACEDENGLEEEMVCSQLQGRPQRKGKERAPAPAPYESRKKEGGR